MTNLSRSAKLVCAGLCVVVAVLLVWYFASRRTKAGENTDQDAQKNMAIESQQGVIEGQHNVSTGSEPGTVGFKSSHCELPFLGRVPALVSDKNFNWVSPDKKTVSMDLKTYYTPDGKWFRSEFARPNSRDESLSAMEIQKDLERNFRRVTGFTKEPLPMSMQEMFTKLHRDVAFEEVAGFAISYLMLTLNSDAAPTPCILFTAWGIKPEADAPADREKRVRIIWDLALDARAERDDL